MPREVAEELKNHNKYPGETVTVQAGRIKIGNKSFQLTENYKEGFDPIELERRYTGFFDKYDYILGDWGHEKLRLHGFFSSSKSQLPAEAKFSHVADYIQEYCNYGCAYFILHRLRQPGETEKPYEVDAYEPLSPKTRPRRQRDRDKGRGKSSKKNSKSGNKRREFSEMTTERPKSNQSSNKQAKKPTVKPDKKFTIRKREN